MTVTAHTEKFGPYTVVRTVRLDNARFPQFTVMRGGQIIARSLSALDRGWCEFLERHAKMQRYVEQPTPQGKYSFAFEEQRRRAGKRGGRAIKVSRIYSSIKG